MTVIIYHNPRCSKSRQVLQLLHDHGEKPDIIEYLLTPPDAGTLQVILTLLNMNPRQLMRKTEDIYGVMGLSNKKISDADLISAMVANPILIERPIVIANGRAALGRPPENILKIL